MATLVVAGAKQSQQQTIGAAKKLGNHQSGLGRACGRHTRPRGRRTLGHTPSHLGAEVRSCKEAMGLGASAPTGPGSSGCRLAIGCRWALLAGAPALAWLWPTWGWASAQAFWPFVLCHCVWGELGQLWPCQGLPGHRVLLPTHHPTEAHTSQSPRLAKDRPRFAPC